MCAWSPTLPRGRGGREPSDAALPAAPSARCAARTGIPGCSHRLAKASARRAVGSMGEPSGAARAALVAVEASAPGKLILFGEHSVVYGAQAVAGAVSDLRIYVRVVSLTVAVGVCPHRGAVEPSHKLCDWRTSARRPAARGLASAAARPDVGRGAARGAHARLGRQRRAGEAPGRGNATCLLAAFRGK